MEVPTSTSTSTSVESESDLEFLRSVDQAELDALSLLLSKSKRQRVTLSQHQHDEGAYTSALKGSHSARAQWNDTSNPPNNTTDGRHSVVRSEGRCYKCGEMGHWARECPTTGKVSVSGPVGAVTGEQEVEVEPCKECPCGAGRCSVLTSNTAKNPGRRFFRCPVRSMGGCNFFEWCDTPQNLACTGPTNQVKSAVAAMLCPCGAGPCQILTTKNGHNAGRQFYRCPVSSGGSSCNFFQWCETDQTRKPAQVEPFSQLYCVTNYPSGQISGGEGGGSSCFRCGREGHWANKCPNQTPNSHPNKTSKPLPSYWSMSGSGSSFGSGSGSGTCFKCGQAGHRSRDCPSKRYSTQKYP